MGKGTAGLCTGGFSSKHPHHGYPRDRARISSMTEKAALLVLSENAALKVPLGRGKSPTRDLSATSGLPCLPTHVFFGSQKKPDFGCGLCCSPEPSNWSQLFHTNRAGHGSECVLPKSTRLSPVTSLSWGKSGRGRDSKISPGVLSCSQEEVSTCLTVASKTYKCHFKGSSL